MATWIISNSLFLEGRRGIADVLLAIVGTQSLVVLGGLVAPVAGVYAGTIFVLVHML